MIGNPWKGRGTGRTFRCTAMPFVFLVCLLLSIPASGHDAPYHRLTAAVLADFPALYTTDDNGQPDGFALDTFKAVVRQIGQKYNLMVVANWGEAIEAVRSGEADVIPGIGITEARKQEFLFSEVFETIPVVCFVRDDTHDIHGIADLSGRRTGVIDQSAAQTRLASVQGILLTRYNSVNEGLFGLLAGKVDAFVLPAPVLWKKARTIGVVGRIKVVGKPLMELKRGYLLRKTDTKLVEQLNQALSDYVASPEFAENYLKWWDKSHLFWDTKRIVMVGGSLFLLTIVLLVIWRYLSVTNLNKVLREAREKLEASEDRLNKAQEVADIGSFERDLRTGEGLWSDGLFKLLNLPVMETTPSVDDFVYMIHPDDRERYRRGIINVSKDNLEYSLEFRFKQDNSDEYRHAFCRFTYEFSEEGTPIKRIGAIQDITGRKQIEAELKAAIQEAETASRVKSEFLANMSHELRTPLNGAMGMLQLLAMDELSPEHRDYVETALASCRSLTQLLGDILDLSKVEAGKLELVTEGFCLSELLASVRETFGLLAADKDIRLECRIDPDVPPCVEGDPVRLRQILFNLVGNALKFTDEGSVTVDVACLEIVPSERCRLLFSVADTGIGIPDDTVEAMFGAFVQGDGAHTRKYQGTGLGLHIVKRLADLMGGNISVESGISQGTTIHFSVGFDLAGDGQGTCFVTENGTIPGVAAKHVLVVEDERTNRLGLCKFLQRMGHSVEWATNGMEALQKLAQGDFDMILMDIQMPIMTGLEATSRIRATESLGHKRDIPIVALTAHAMSGDREAFLQAGMNDYLSKPIDMVELKRVLARVFRKDKA